MIKAIVLVFVGLAFLILILGAAFSHSHCDASCSYCHDDYDHFEDEPMCEEECDATGEFGECSKCGWIDHLAQSKKAAD